MKMKKVLVGIAATSIALSLAACSGGGGRGGSAGGTEDNKGALVGVAMPTKTSERWVDDGNNVNDQLTKLGYKVDLQYANDKVQDQISQIETMLNKGAKALIVASIDGTALTQVLKTAADDGVKVIAYDRLINGTEDVDYSRRSTTSRSACSRATPSCRASVSWTPTARPPAAPRRRPSRSSPAARTTTTRSSSTTAR